MYVRSRKIDPNFVPNAKQINAIKGMIIGAIEDPFLDGCSVYGDVQLDWHWISANIPAANPRMNELIEADFIWQREWAEGDYTFGFNPEAYDWIATNFAFPSFNDVFDVESDKAHLWASILRETFVPKKPKQVRGCWNASAKTTTKWVKQISYTPDEAFTAMMEAYEAVGTGKLPPHSLPAIKAHITRRTVQATA